MAAPKVTRMHGLRRAAVPLAAVLVAAAAYPAYAVSDGDYSSAQQGCTPNADNSDHPTRAEKGCYTATVGISDAHHRYVTVGVPQTPNGTPANAVVLCLDLTGTVKCARVDKSGFTPLPDRRGTKPDPGSAQLRVYFGADDNLDSGEHDSSEQVSNGPSDGGGIQVNVHPLTAAQWFATVMSGNRSAILTHPLPAADAGFGGCADGLCFSVQTQRRVAYRSGAKHPRTRDAANYSGHTWDPPTCAGPTDSRKDCGGHPLSWWHQRNQTTYVEPGLQIYEDPDPQGSPEGPYPLPAFYVGTCGLVVGGGTAPPLPHSRYTNSAGQLVVPTGC